MRFPPAPHRWTVSPKAAIAIQKELAVQVKVEAVSPRVRHVVGVDSAFSRDGKQCIAAAVVWDSKQKVILERQTASRKLRFSYVPGLLSFREAPAILAALRKLRLRPDVLMCDGHGLAHPRRFGIACHLGVLVDLPTIGCAKSRLVGVHREPAQRRSCHTRLMDGNDCIGSVLRTRDRVKPIFVSVGHKIQLHQAVRLVLSCCIGYRLPEPTRQADHLVSRSK